MPFITIKVLDRKTIEQKRTLIQKMTGVVSEVFNVRRKRAA
jgi:4-oxalocrotonate tautomerase